MPIQNDKPPRCKCCKRSKPTNIKGFNLHTYEGQLWCSDCVFGHDNDPVSTANHTLRKFCSCCESPATGGYYNLQVRTGLCPPCIHRPSCKPGGPHISTIRGEGSPSIHQHSCFACRRWFFCDCQIGTHKLEQVSCGCAQIERRPQATARDVHSHTCARCQDASFRCLVDDENARPTCTNCRGDVASFVASSFQIKSIKTGKRRKALGKPRTKTAKNAPERMEVQWLPAEAFWDNAMPGLANANARRILDDA